MKKLFIFGSEDWLAAFDAAGLHTTANLVGFMFNVKPRCFTYLRHNLGDYLLAKAPKKFRSVGFKCIACASTVHKARALAHEVFDCHCSFAVLGKGTMPFTASEWYQYRLRAIERELPVRAQMEGGSGRN